jgi:hypothetical protein
MTVTVMVAVLFRAFLHALWNALVRASSARVYDIVLIVAGAGTRRLSSFRGKEIVALPRKNTGCRICNSLSRKPALLCKLTVSNNVFGIQPAVFHGMVFGDLG